MRNAIFGFTLLLTVLGEVCFIPDAQADEAASRQALKEAFAAAAKNDERSTYAAVRKAIDDPDFGKLETGAQHAALQLAYFAAYRAKDFGQANLFAARATDLPDPDQRDWSFRLASAAQIENVRDEAHCIAVLVNRFDLNSTNMPIDVVRRVYRDTEHPEFREARKEMLLTLYDRGWRSESEWSASQMWLSLSLLLLEDHDAAKAVQVVSLVDEPLDVIALHADARYQPLLKSPYLQSDAHQAARSRLKALREYAALHPRSLAAIQELSSLLLTMREEQEALELTTQADKKVAAAAGSPAFDDVGKHYPWILNKKSDALSQLGRFEEAVAELRRAVALPHPDDQVSQAINLAFLLCDLGRPDEAMQVLPKMDDASDYGKTQLVEVELRAAVERGDAAAAQKHLEYLHAHQEVSPATYQEALLVLGDMDKAKAYLLSRLEDPGRRTAALLELQTYSESKRPPHAQMLHAASQKLKLLPEVQQALTRVGSANRYLWRYDLTS